MEALTWKRRLSEYRAGRYSISTPHRGAMVSLFDEGNLVGRYRRLCDAKDAAEKREISYERQALGVGMQGHEWFQSVWGDFDVTVANTLAEQSGELSVISVDDCAVLLSERVVKPDGSFTLKMGITTEPDRVDKADLSYPVTVATLVSRGGKVLNLVIDGWHRIAKAKRDGVATLPCRVLSAEHSSLVKL